MKVKVLYQTVNEIEVEVDEKFAECVRLADLPWDSNFPLDCIDKWLDDREKMRGEIAEKLLQIDNGFDDIITITTENNNIIYEN
jgi:hypothetical protein